MDSKRFAEFRHDAVHQLIQLNQNCELKYRISFWPRWDYELERATLTFSQDGVPRVIASIQVIGSTSKSSGTWLWGWANQTIHENAVAALAKVREFGEREHLAELTEPRGSDDGHTGWEMTAIAASLIGAKGAYRCPSEDGFLYVVYLSLDFAGEVPAAETGLEELECSTHGSGFQTCVCEHLVADPAQKWYSQEPDPEHQWPDAWCAACDVFFQEEGEWNDKNSDKLEDKAFVPPLLREPTVAGPEWCGDRFELDEHRNSRFTNPSRGDAPFQARRSALGARDRPHRRDYRAVQHAAVGSRRTI